MTVQDNFRETELIRVFGLLPGDDNRIGVDAYDVFGNEFELKTTSKGSVSTARDLGPAHIEKWSKRFWIIATFDKNQTEIGFDRYFFFSRCHLAEWYAKMMGCFDKDGVLAESVIGLIDGKLPDSDVDRVKYLFKRGMCKNDPNIPWDYVQRHGIEITENHAERLAELVREYPI